MDNAEVAKIFGVALGLVVVVLLSNWLFPDGLADTIVWVLAAP